MPDQEEFESQTADHESTSTSTVGDDAVATEPDMDAGGVGFGHDTAEPAADGGAKQSASSPEVELDETDLDGVGVGADVDALAAQAAKAEEYLTLAQRTRADFDNFRKRAARDAAAAGERGTIKLARELLPALDNLERAIAHAAAEDPLLEGIKFVHSDLLAALNRSGIDAFSPAGEPFDPQLHEAVAQHAQEGAETGTVLEVYQQGYRLADTVLRPARVLVAA